MSNDKQIFIIGGVASCPYATLLGSNSEDDVRSAPTSDGRVWQAVTGRLSQPISDEFRGRVSALPMVVRQIIAELISTTNIKEAITFKVTHVSNQLDGGLSAERAADLAINAVDASALDVTRIALTAGNVHINLSYHGDELTYAEQALARRDGQLSDIVESNAAAAKALRDLTSLGFRETGRDHSFVIALLGEVARVGETGRVARGIKAEVHVY